MMQVGKKTLNFYTIKLYSWALLNEGLKHSKLSGKGNIQYDKIARFLMVIKLTNLLQETQLMIFFLSVFLIFS